MKYVEQFCRQVLRRSEENRQAFTLLAGQRLFGPMIALLRQELDSLVRVIYLLSIADQNYRGRLVKASTEGQPWTTPEGRKVTDRCMVDLASHLHGWASSVYRFGCGFIHLSSMHDYQATDPFKALSEAERRSIVDHINYYHGATLTPGAEYKDLLPFLPRIYDKIASNLISHVTELQEGAVLDDHTPKVSVGKKMK